MDSSRDFFVDGLTHEFQLLPTLFSAEFNNCSSAVCPSAKSAVESKILDEIHAGNYVVCSHKPTIIIALRAVSKPGFPGLHMIYDFSMSPGQRVHNYIDTDKQNFQILDGAMHLMSCRGFTFILYFDDFLVVGATFEEFQLTYDTLLHFSRTLIFC